MPTTPGSTTHGRGPPGGTHPGASVGTGREGTLALPPSLSRLPANEAWAARGPWPRTLHLAKSEGRPWAYGPGPSKRIQRGRAPESLLKPARAREEAGSREPASVRAERKRLPRASSRGPEERKRLPRASSRSPGRRRRLPRASSFNGPGRRRRLPRASSLRGSWEAEEALGSPPLPGPRTSREALGSLFAP